MIDLKDILNTALNFLSSDSWRTGLVLTYNDKDITADISNYIESFSFTERARNGESDDLNITVENTTRIWLNEWFPERGATLTAQIITENLNQPKLVNKMAERHGFDVFFDSDYDPVIDRFDQKMNLTTNF